MPAPEERLGSILKPLLLLDIDGVFNPYAAKPTRRPEGYETHRILMPDRFSRKPLRVWLNPTHGPLLLEFASEHEVELVWASMWGQWANILVAPKIGLLGVPLLPFIDFDAGDWDFRAWKYPRVREYVGDRPFLWFDDEFAEKDHRAAREAFEASLTAPYRLIDVSPRTGLLPDHLAEAADWLEDLRAAV